MVIMSKLLNECCDSLNLSESSFCGKMCPPRVWMMNADTDNQTSQGDSNKD